MEAIGIICEYNPFHHGHKYQLDEVRKLFSDARSFPLAAVMSGNYTQRGEAAFADKYTRARTALPQGINAVFELPFPFSSLSAEGFAASGVRILSALGSVGYLAFGAECGDLGLLREIAEVLADNRLERSLESLIAEYPGLSYPVLRQKALESEMGGKVSDVIRQPNNILAIEYLKAIIRQKSPLRPILIRRVGSHYNSPLPEGEYASASAVRAVALSDFRSAEPFLPEAVYRILLEGKNGGVLPADGNRLSDLIFCKLLSLRPERLQALCGSAELAGRLISAFESSSGLNEAIAKASTRKFTAARIRRTLLFLLFDLPHGSFDRILPLYTNVLAADDAGCAFLSAVRKTSGIALYTKPAHTSGPASAELKRQLELQRLSDMLYPLLMPRRREPEFFIKSGPFIQNKGPSY